MRSNKPAPLLIHDWTVFAHPLFLAQLEAIVQQVEGLKERDPVGYVKKNANKRLAAIAKLAFDVIPQDPTRPEYRQGNTLGDDYKHWFRAKFFQQYRLFFRYHAPSKVIVLAWVNDEDTKRAYESGDDAYRVFRKILASGHPPDDWDQLLKEAKPAAGRLQSTLDAEIFRQYCELLNAPVKDNTGLARLITLTPPWSKAADIESTGETK